MPHDNNSIKRRSTSGALIRGAVSGWFGHFIGIVSTFFLTPLIIGGLGTIGYGVWSMIITITGYYGLVDFGIGIALTKFLSQHVANNEDAKVVGILSSAARTYIWLAVLVQVIAIVIGFVIPSCMSLEGVKASEFLVVASLLGGRASCSLIATLFRAYLRACGAFSWINMLGIASQISTALGVGYVMLSDGGFVGMGIVLLAVGSASLLVMAAIATIKFRFPWNGVYHQKPERSGELFSFGALVVTARVVHKLSQKIGTLGAIWLGGPAMVAYYSLAETACEKSIGVMVPIRQMIIPTASALSASKDLQSHMRLIYLAPRVFLAMGLGLAVLIYAYGRTFLTLWVGADFTGQTWPILSVLAIAIPLRSMGNCQGLLLQGMGRVRIVTGVACLEGVCLVASVFLLCSIFGVMGLAWAVVISTFVSSALVLPYVITQVNAIHIGKFYWNVVPPALLVGGAAFASTLLTGFWGVPTSYLDILARCMLAIFCGAMVACFCCADRPLRARLLQPVKSRFHSFRRSTGNSNESFIKSIPEQD